MFLSDALVLDRLSKISYYLILVLGIESRALCLLGKHVTTELLPQPWIVFLR